MPEIVIREEQPEDIPAIRFVNEQAFGQPQEAGIVDALRLSGTDLLSLVAFLDRQVVGHILFSPVAILHDHGTLQGMGLGPLAVLPEYQRLGIGSRLAETGLAIIKQRNYPFVVVLGHAEYYPRFGFQRASLYGINSQWQGIPDEAFMILVFKDPAMQGIKGVAYYRVEFDESIPSE